MGQRWLAMNDRMVDGLVVYKLMNGWIGCDAIARVSVKEAVEEAMSDLRDLRDPYSAHINLIAVDKAGNYAGMSYRPEKKFAVIRGGEQAATVLDHDDPHPVPGGMDTIAYRHQQGMQPKPKGKL